VLGGHEPGERPGLFFWRGAEAQPPGRGEVGVYPYLYPCVCDSYTPIRLVDDDLPRFDQFQWIGRSLGSRSRRFKSCRPDRNIAECGLRTGSQQTAGHGVAGSPIPTEVSVVQLTSLSESGSAVVPPGAGRRRKILSPRQEHCGMWIADWMSATPRTQSRRFRSGEKLCCGILVPPMNLPSSFSTPCSDQIVNTFPTTANQVLAVLIALLTASH
jgi:hypothetical protein